MIEQFIQKFNDELVKGVGLSSSYTEDKVENIQRRLPETVTTNTFIGIVAGDQRPLQFEIGQNLPRHFIYSIDFAILVKDTNFDDGLNRLSKIVKRVIKTLTTSEVLTLTYTDDTINERPYHYSIEKISYESGPGKSNAHLAVITVSIKTEFSY